MVDMSNLLNLQITIFCLMLAGYILTKTKVLSAEARKPLSNLLINFVLPCNIITSFIMEFNRKIMMDCLAILIVSVCIQTFAIFTSKYYYPKTEPKKCRCFATEPSFPMQGLWEIRLLRDCTGIWGCYTLPFI